MIVVFPMLTDNTVNTAAVPGIAAALEKFALIYKMDTILKWGGLPADSRLIGFARGSLDMLTRAHGLPMPGLFESENLAEASPRNNPNPPTPEEKAAERDEQREYEREKSDREEYEKNTSGFHRDATLKLDAKPLKNAISVEPTYAVVSGRAGTSIVGVKVIPYPIESRDFVKAIMIDTKLNGVDRFLSKYERTVTRMFYSFARKMALPVLKKLPLKKDPYNDVVYARSRYGKDVFCLLNLASLENDDLFTNQGGVDKLYDMGWNAICIADDVSKRVYMCMKEYGGLCSIVNYPYLFASLGKEYGEAYGDLQDLKKSSSVFAKKVSPSSIFSLRESQNILNNYSKLNIPCLRGDC